MTKKPGTTTNTGLDKRARLGSGAVAGVVEI